MVVRPFMHAAPLARQGFGATITGSTLSLQKALADVDQAVAVAEHLRRRLDQHKVLLWRHPESELRPQDHVALAELLGSIFPLPPRFQHERSPIGHKILRMSNVGAEGFTGVGTAGWHSDGLSYATPFRYAVLHIVRAPTDSGPTHFLDLGPVAAAIRKQQPSWEHLWIRCGEGEKAVQHPLLFQHPRTGRPGVCLGKTSGFAWCTPLDTERSATQSTGWRPTGVDETAEVRAALASEVARVAETAGATYHHEWEEGDTLLVDNLAVAHVAPPQTQQPPAAIGLRVLDRVVVAGTQPLLALHDRDRAVLHTVGAV